MKSITALLVLGAVLSGVTTASSLTVGVPPRTAQGGRDQAASWPKPVPCRINDGSNRDLFVMTLGDVNPSIADGVYDPVTDEVRLKDGSIRSAYYRDTLGIKFFRPIDKSRFPLPPSGWCSWYYYYSDVTEEEVKQNARWIAANLKDYGAVYVQIDDGWQGVGRARNRDWTSLSEKFPGGMAGLASFIKSLGLIPGIWLAPHGQSNETVVKNNPGVFLLKPDGASASESWEGRFLIDPSAAESTKYLADLFSSLSKWGYEYFKIDGQPVVVGEYKGKKSFMKNPSEDPVPLYRNTVETIRKAIGPDRFLLGCWGIPIEGVGLMNGSRTGGDVVLGWNGGFTTALRATMQHYYLHNIVWYCDPDTLLVRSPLTIEQARAWATLQGLTGQALLSSDRLMDLSEDRVDMLKRVYPAVDIRPLDLFPSQRNKRIWDLKVSHLGRNYDVVGVFNFDESKSEEIQLSFDDLGLDTKGPVHIFDFWNKEYLGFAEAGTTVNLPPSSCRVLTLLPASDQIQLISTNRHITQGWVDLIAQSYDSQKSSYRGKSRVIKGDPYELRFVFPPGRNFTVKRATGRSASGNLPVKIVNHQGWAAIQISSPATTDVEWEASFEPAGLYHYPVREPANLSTERVGLDGIKLRWSPQYYLNAGYRVYLNGRLLGYTPVASFTARGLDPGQTYTAEVQTVWEDGAASQKKTEVKFTIASLLPQTIFLSDLEQARSSIAGLRRTPIIGGRPRERSIEARPGSEIEFDLHGLFQNFSVETAVDDSSGAETAIEFVIVGDGKELWRSGALKKSDGPKPATVSVAGVRRLTLRVSGRGERGSQGDWISPKLTDLSPDSGTRR